MRYESSFSGNYLTPDLLGLRGKMIRRLFARSCWLWGVGSLPRFHGRSCSTAGRRCRSARQGQPHPKTGNAAARKAGAFPWNIPDGFLSRLPLCSYSTPSLHHVCKNRPKLRLIPSLFLRCCSEVRRRTIKINAPPRFLFPWKKKRKSRVRGGENEVYKHVIICQGDKTPQLLSWLLVRHHQMNIV